MNITGVNSPESFIIMSVLKRVAMNPPVCFWYHAHSGGHGVCVPVTYVAVSMRDHLSCKDPSWRLLENVVAVATASRERCYLVRAVTLLMEGRVGAWGMPRDTDERFKS